MTNPNKIPLRVIRDLLIYDPLRVNIKGFMTCPDISERPMSLLR